MKQRNNAKRKSIFLLRCQCRIHDRLTISGNVYCNKWYANSYSDSGLYSTVRHGVDKYYGQSESLIILVYCMINLISNDEANQLHLN